MALKRKTTAKMGDDYKAHLRAIHHLPLSIDLVRGIVEKLHECKSKGSLKSHWNKVAADMMVIRPPDLRKGAITVGEYLYPSGAFTKDGVFKDNPYSAYIPSLISQCSDSSELMTTPCKRCALGHGAFASCRVDGNHEGCCLNCWHSTSIWDCTLVDKKGKEKPKRKKAAVKTEPMNTPSAPGTPTPIPAPVRRRKRVENLSPTPEPVSKRSMTTKNALMRAPTTYVAPASLGASECYGAASNIASEHDQDQIAHGNDMEIASSLHANANVSPNPALEMVVRVIDNETTLGGTGLVDRQLAEDEPADASYEAMINNKTFPPWRRQFPPSNSKTPILFAGTRKPKDVFHAELKRVTTQHRLPAPFIRKRGLTVQKRTTKQMSPTPKTFSVLNRKSHPPSDLAPMIFTSSKSALSGPPPPWQAQLDTTAKTQDATLFQGTRKTSEVFYTYFGLAKTAQTNPASALLSVPAFRTRKPRVPASARASSSTLLRVSRDESSTVPGVTANALKSFARHALSFVFD